MNAKEIKNQVISDLTEIQKLCIEEIGGFAEFNGDAEDFIWQNRKGLPENWQVQGMLFPSEMVPVLLKRVKSNFPNGDEPKHKEKTKKIQDANGIELQKYIHELRQKYQQKTDFPDGYTMNLGGRCLRGDDLRAKMQAEKDAIKKLAEKNGIVLDCWAYISNPKELEGVHYAWVNPVVKFEPCQNYAN